MSDCILCAAYLINITPLQSINNATPHFRLNCIDPSLSYLQVFECLCFASSSIDHMIKFDPKAIAYVFLGYSVTQKGYKVLSLANKQLFVSRDVIFHEIHFPFHSHTRPTLYPTDIYLPSVTELSTFDTSDTDVLLDSSAEHDPTNSTNTAASSSAEQSSSTPHFPPDVHDLSTDVTLDLRRSNRVHKTPGHFSESSHSSSSSSKTQTQ